MWLNAKKAKARIKAQKNIPPHIAHPCRGEPDNRGRGRDMPKRCEADLKITKRVKLEARYSSIDSAILQRKARALRITNFLSHDPVSFSPTATMPVNRESLVARVFARHVIRHGERRTIRKETQGIPKSGISDSNCLPGGKPADLPRDFVA
jgi:hypothetical protein